MSITETRSAFVVGAGQTVSLASMISVAAGSANPTCLILTTLDRDEYTAGASGAVTNAVNDALRPLGATPITEIPIRPDAVLRALARRDTP